MGKNTWEFPVGDNAIDVMKQGGYNYYIENLQKKSRKRTWNLREPTSKVQILPN